MQCPSCQNTNLTPSGDGKLVCDDCGEQFAGYQEEEVDFVLTGTAISTRQSQSSQAYQLRQRLQSCPIDLEPSKPKTADDVLICEGAFHLSKALVNRLIALDYLDQRVKVPLFEILTCWVRARHSFADFSSLRKPFQPYHVLSMVCLAALYTRSPLLPRDLCRLVNIHQIPFLAALKTVFPANFEKTDAVRQAFTPRELPVARHVIRYANKFARGKESWPPLRQFFRSNADAVSEFQFSFDEDTLVSRKNITSFPVGHLHITLLRIVRLLGLPDDFGARVLRFIELRRMAVKMARVLARETSGPWDDSMVDAYDIDHIPNYSDPKKVFSKPLPRAGDLYSFPTDESLQVDIINTMRLCYGRERGGGIMKDGDNHDVASQLQEEWKACKEAMMMWLKYGNPEDIDNVTWTSLSPNVLALMRGKQLRDYARLVDDILGERGEEPPEMWERFISAFETIGQRGRRERTGGTVDDGGEREKEYDHVRTEKACMYDIDRCGDKPVFDIGEDKEDMDKETVAYQCDEKYCRVEEGYERHALREYGDHEIAMEPGKRKRRRPPKERDFVVEPAGIGLAWTIMTRFFEGTNVVVAGTEVTPTERSKIVRLRTACDRTMEIVVKYVLGLKLRNKSTQGVT